MITLDLVGTVALAGLVLLAGSAIQRRVRPLARCTDFSNALLITAFLNLWR